MADNPLTTTPLINAPLIDAPLIDAPLIDATQLSRLLRERPAGAPVLLDVRWTLAGSDHDGYQAAHIPGALFVDLDRELAGPPGLGGRHPLPDPADLQTAWRARGIDDDSSVVVYDGGSGLASARAWWLLRWSGLRDVRVLDGGLPAWLTEAGRPIAAGAERAGHPGTITVRPGAMPVVEVDRATELAESGALIDARAAARYRGEIEPLDPVAGHIPGSLNLPIGDLLAADGTFRPAAELRAAFVALGVQAEQTTAGQTDAEHTTAGQTAAEHTTAGQTAAEHTTAGQTAAEQTNAEQRNTVAASCGSGITACQLILAAEVAGLELALYPGSYSQWCALGRPVAVGA